MPLRPLVACFCLALLPVLLSCAGGQSRIAYREETLEILARSREPLNETAPVAPNQLLRLREMTPESADVLLDIVADAGHPLNRRATHLLMQLWGQLTPDQVRRYFDNALLLSARVAERYPQFTNEIIEPGYQIRHGWIGWPDISPEDFQTHTRHYLDNRQYGPVFEFSFPMATTGWVRLSRLQQGKHHLNWKTDYEIRVGGEKIQGSVLSPVYAFEIIAPDTLPSQGTRGRGEAPAAQPAPLDPRTDRLVYENLVLDEIETDPKLNRGRPWSPQLGVQGLGDTGALSLHLPVWRLKKPLPVDLCFEVEFQMQDNGEVLEGNELLALKGETPLGYFEPHDIQRFVSGRDGFVPLRVILKPSARLAEKHPELRQYYNRVVRSPVLRAKISRDEPAPAYWQR